jgi:hypothetical protein
MTLPMEGVMKLRANSFANFESSDDGSEVTLLFVQDADQEIEVTLPFDSVMRTSVELLRMCLATAQKQVSNSEQRQGYSKVGVSQVKQIDIRVDATKSSLILVFDGGTPKQIAYSVTPDGARQMAIALVQKAASCNERGTGH